MDFGIARSMEAMTRMTGSLAGTPQYMAPGASGGKAGGLPQRYLFAGANLYEIVYGHAGVFKLTIRWRLH